MKTAQKTAQTPSLAVNPTKTLSSLDKAGKIKWEWNADRTARIAYIPVYVGTPETISFDKGKETVEYDNLGTTEIDGVITDPETKMKVRICPKEGWKNGKRTGVDRICARPVGEPKAATVSKDEGPF